jgi:hypothetical protein
MNKWLSFQYRWHAVLGLWDEIHYHSYLFWVVGAQAILVVTRTAQATKK